MNRINSFDIEKKLVPLLQYYTKYSVIFSKKKKKITRKCSCTCRWVGQKNSTSGAILTFYAAVRVGLAL